MSEVYRLEPMPSRGPTLVSVCASEVAIEPIEWLWPGRLAVGKHTCIAGEPGASKSQLTMDVAARISMASEWPCGEGQAPQGSTIILSAEDGAADTIAPRLHASGADLGRIHIVTAVRDGKGSDNQLTFPFSPSGNILIRKKGHNGSRSTTFITII